jgi:hypothetical protein
MKIFYPLQELKFKFIVPFLLMVGLPSALLAQLTIDMPNAVETQVTGINDSWDIVGFYTNADGITEAFYISKGDTIFYKHNNYNTWFGGINNYSRVVGRYNPTGNIGDYHAFVLNLTNMTTAELPILDGYEYMSPNDINDYDAISGDLKDGANRRFFIYDQNGLNTQSYLIGGTPVPTYGGYGLDNQGRLSGWYLDAGNYISFRYHPDFGYMNVVDLNDPESNLAHKTRLMGMNNDGKAVLDFIVSDNAHIYDFGAPNSWPTQEKFIPASTEIHLHDINSSKSVCGYYMDANNVVHGYADVAFLSEFNVLQHGNSFVNSVNPVWPGNLFPNGYYSFDHYWYNDNFMPFPRQQPGYVFYHDSYPSWLDYVDMLSPASCYYNIPSGNNQFTDYPVMRPNAFATWKVYRKSKFEGACFGMASNAAKSWQFPQLLSSKFHDQWDNSQYGGWDNLYIRENDAIAYANIGQASQLSREFKTMHYNAIDIRADSVINAVAKSLMGGGEIPVIAATLTGNGILCGHALLPFAIYPWPEINKYSIIVYDPNSPGNENITIDVFFDPQYGKWTFLFGTIQTNLNTHGLRLLNTSTLYEEYLTPGMSEVHSDPGLSAEIVRDENIRLFTLEPVSFNITGNGGVINVSDDIYENTIAGSEPWLWYGGMDIIPDQFTLPSGDFTLTTPEDTNAVYTGGMMTGNTIIMYNRYDTQEGQEDIIQSSGTALTYLNNIGESVGIVAEVTTQDGDAEFYYEVNNLTLEANQSVTLEYTAPYLYITNSGAATEYDVTIQIMDEVTGLFETLAANVNLGDGVTQEIIPVFDENGITGISITEFDEDPNTEDVIFTVENSGIPELVLGMDTLVVFPTGGANNVAVANFGAGMLEWNVLSSPSWISISQSSGINYGTVEFSVEANDNDTRDGFLIVQNINNTSEVDTLYIQQIGALGVIDDNNLSQHIQLWPNPTHGMVYLKKASHLSGKQMNYEVISSDGKLVRSGSFNNDQVSIDLSTLPTGLYQIRLNADGILIAKRVMVE